MNKNESLKETVDIFYKDIINVIKKRMERDQKIIIDNINNEKKLNDEIVEKENEINRIINNDENHINKNGKFNLTPKWFVSFDKLKKQLEYKKEELRSLCEYNKKKGEYLNNKNREYLNTIKKYMEEKIGIIECISKREHLDVVKLAEIQKKEYDNIKKLNDSIFNQYLPS